MTSDSPLFVTEKSPMAYTDRRCATKEYVQSASQFFVSPRKCDANTRRTNTEVLTNSAVGMSPSVASNTCFHYQLYCKYK